MDERRISGPFKFRNEIGDLLIEVVCRGFDFIILLKAFGHAIEVFAGNSADAVLDL